MLVPQPGIGPGRPNWSRECKSRLSANSSTGARKLQDVGTHGTFEGFGVPTFFGLSSAAPIPSSWFSLLSTSARLNRFSQHANHCFQNLAVCFGQVHAV